MNDQVVAISPPFRRGTRIEKTKVALVYNSGGIGDFIHWTTAIKFAIDSNPHLYGNILAPTFFLPLAKLWLDGYSDRFVVVEYKGDWADEPCTEDSACIVPGREQLANAAGFHLFALGFIYYNQMSRIPAGYETIPRVSGNETSIEHFGLPEKYAVITTNATADNRRLKGHQVNDLISYVKRKGLTPVILGKNSMADDYVSKDPEGIRTHGCIDLREETDLIEAACILAKAKFVIGLDNGLLHLAACSDVPVVMIFTSVDPGTRIPPRAESAGKTLAIAPDEKLACRFCNTNMRYIIGFDFKGCLYKDMACIETIDVRKITEVIDRELFRNS